MQERAKRQLKSRKVVAKDGVLTGDEAMKQIKSRRMEEIEQAREKILFWNKRKNARKIFKHKLDFIIELDNPHRSAPRAK